MSFQDPYVARDINFNALGRVEILVGADNLDQIVQRYISSRLRQLLGKKIDARGIDTLVRVNLQLVGKEIRSAQEAASNYFYYEGNELIEGIDLVSLDKRSPGTLYMVVRVYLKSGAQFTTTVGV